MEKIKITCTSGITLPISEMTVYSGKLKKHSQLEIERLCDSIVKNGFLFPIAVGKLKDKNYVLDGECRLFALQELEYRGYEIPDIPVYYVRTNEKTIKKNILLATSTNHCVTKTSIEHFIGSEHIDIKQLSFNEGTLIDFFTSNDFDRFFAKYDGCKKIVSNVDYNGMLLGGQI